MMEWQRQILNLLIDKRERSKAYQGEAKVHRRVSISPADVFPVYDSAQVDVEEVLRFEQEVQTLERLDAVETDWPGRPDHTLRRIQAREDHWEMIYSLAGRRELRDETAEQIQYYQGAGQGKTARSFCAEEVARLAAGKKPRYTLERARTLIELLDVIEQNDQELLERELSIRFFGDSKTFEKSYRKAVTEMLIKYSGRDYPMDRLENPENAREKQILVLSEHGIEPNPSYLYMKGDGEILLADGRCIQLYADMPTAFLAEDLRKLRGIRLASDFVMTVENLTAYNRLSLSQGMCLFLSGYHTSGMERILRKIGAAYPEISFYHFGDMDPCGMEILEHLRTKTELPFQPWHMGVAELERFQEYGRPLEPFDIEKLRRLRMNPRWSEAAIWMLKHQIKLEQEIVAFLLASRE